LLALHQSGYLQAAIIGRVKAESEQGKPVTLLG